MIRNRFFLHAVLLSAAVGCGSGEQAAPVALSIPNPESSSAQTGAASGSPQTGAEAVESMSENPALAELIERARTAAANGAPAIAIEAMSQAISIDASRPELFLIRAQANNALREYADARADFSMAVHLAPDSGEYLNARGYFLMNQGLAEEAAADFDKANQVSPDFPQAWNNRGLLFLAVRDFSAAEERFAQAVRLKPDYFDAWNNRGFARTKQQKFDEAEKDLRKAVELRPEYSTAWNNLGLLHAQREQWEEAAAAFSEAIRHEPLDIRWVNHRRSALQKLERFSEAARDNQRIKWLAGLQKISDRIRERPTDLSVWQLRGDYLNMGGEHVAAVNDFSRILAMNPEHSPALNSRAEAWLALGQPQKALTDASEALALALPGTDEADLPTAMATAPEQARRSVSLRGEAWLATNRLDEAIRDFEILGRFDGVVAEAYRERSRSLERIGDDEGAARDRERAEQIEAALEGRAVPSDSPETEPIPFPSE